MKQKKANTHRPAPVKTVPEECKNERTEIKNGNKY